MKCFHLVTFVVVKCSNLYFCINSQRIKMNLQSEKEWFKCWFNSEYYHVLYKDRDAADARILIDNIVSLLKPDHDSKILDIGCGKGRHSLYFSKKNYFVTGIDISEKNIEYARKSENDRLSFFVHDMRNLFRINFFDIALNLFTSFGYFEKERENRNAIASVVKSLKPGGIFVIDFMNSKKVIRELVAEELKAVDGIDFTIKRYIENDFIIKEIDFFDKGINHSFTERVRTFTKDDFDAYLGLYGFKTIHLFGDYYFNEFDEQKSDRLIIIAQKGKK